MKGARTAAPAVALMIAGSLILAACGSNHAAGNTGTARPATAGSPQAVAAGGEQPVAAEKNPAGDIPDTQAFVSYTSAAGGYTVDSPEGWARTDNGPNVQFTDKLDGEAVTVARAGAAPTAATARDTLVKTGRAVQVTKVQDVQLPGGAAVLVSYNSNSDPNSVTGKQVRLENQAYLFFKNGKLATLTLSAPLGADNVDQWQRIARSFRWS